MDLARLLERGKFDGLFIADVLGVYDVLNGSGDAAIRRDAGAGQRSAGPDHSDGAGDGASGLRSDRLAVV